MPAPITCSFNLSKNSKVSTAFNPAWELNGVAFSENANHSDFLPSAHKVTLSCRTTPLGLCSDSREGKHAHYHEKPLEPDQLTGQREDPVPFHGGCSRQKPESLGNCKMWLGSHVLTYFESKDSELCAQWGDISQWNQPTHYRKHSALGCGNI